MARQELQSLETEYVDLRMLLHTIQEKKWLLAGIACLTFILAMAYALMKPIQYQATVLLEVHHKQESSLGSISDYSQHGSSDSVTEEPISLQVALIRSKFILEPVIRSLNLALQKPEAEVIEELRSHLMISDLSGSSDSSSKKAGILQLSMTGRNPEIIMKIVNKIALITQEKDKERKAKEAKKTLEFLYQQLPIIQASLKEAEAKLNLYRSTSGKIDGKLQTQYLLTHLSDINKQLEATHLRKMDLSQDYTALHPLVISLKQKQKELEKRRNQVLHQIKNLPAADQVAANLARDVKVKNNLYMIILNKIHEQQVITAGIVSDISILSLANYPDKPLVLKLPVVACVSLVLGLFLGCLVILTASLKIVHFSRPSARH